MSRPSRSTRKRLSLYEFMERFNTEEKAMAYFESRRWKGERHCPRCGSVETREASHKTMPYWCKDCRKYFSVKTGTPLEKSPIPYRKWLMAIYLMSTSIKGISSTKLGNDLGIKQSHAWFLAHRIRQGWATTASELLGMTVEVDEVYIGGKEKNKHKDKKLKEGRGAVGKAAVLGIKDRKGKKVKALKIESTNAQTLHWIILENVVKGSKVYTDEHRSYLGLEKKGYEHGTVHHSAGEYVNGQIHTNGIESFWALLKRGYYGVYYKMSVKHLQKYIDEFCGRYNVRQIDTIDQIDSTIHGLLGAKKLTYKEFISV